MDTGFNCLPSEPSPAWALGLESTITSFSKVYNYTRLLGSGFEEYLAGRRAPAQEEVKEERGIPHPKLSRDTDVEMGDGGGVWVAGGQQVPVGDGEEELQEQGLEVTDSHSRVLWDWVRMSRPTHSGALGALAFPSGKWASQ